jgi:IS4 transposase
LKSVDTSVSEQAEFKLYTATVNCVNLKRAVRIMYLVKKTGYFALLFSTDTELDAGWIYRYYKARFQIEVLFRDAKQFTGLTIKLAQNPLCIVISMPY